MSEHLVSSSVEGALDLLESCYRQELDELDETIDADDTQLTLRYGSGDITPGSIICVGYELMMVKANGDQLSVIRSLRGSEPVAHEGGELVDLSPRFNRWTALRRMRQEILSWPPSLFAVDIDTFETDGEAQGYGVDPTGIRRLLRVEIGPESSSTSELFRLVDGWRWDPTSSFPEGGALYLPAYAAGRIVKMTLARDFGVDVWSEHLDLVDEVLLSEHMVDLLEIGTAWRMLNEAPRTSSRAAGSSAGPETVPPGHIASVKDSLRRDRKERIAEEANRLKDLYRPVVET